MIASQLIFLQKMHPLTFHKKERIKKKKLVEKLFREGSSFIHPPFKIYWHAGAYQPGPPAQALITAGKKNLRKAVSRNRVKRLTREAYRQHKSDLYEFLKAKKIHCLIGIIYTGSEDITFEQMDKKIIEALRRLKEDVQSRLNNKSR